MAAEKRHEVCQFLSSGPWKGRHSATTLHDLLADSVIAQVVRRTPGELWSNAATQVSAISGHTAALRELLSASFSRTRERCGR